MFYYQGGFYMGIIMGAWVLSWVHGYYFRGKVFCKCKQRARTRIVNLLPTEKTFAKILL